MLVAEKVLPVVPVTIEASIPKVPRAVIISSIVLFAPKDRFIVVVPSSTTVIELPLLKPISARVVVFVIFSVVSVQVSSFS